MPVLPDFSVETIAEDCVAGVEEVNSQGSMDMG
jgi:hypothetical protein